MAHFAKVEGDKVVDVHVVNDADCGGGDYPGSEAVGQAFIASLNLEGLWLQTSYNTRGGQHANNGTPIRKNYAMIGGTYDSVQDAFIPIKPSDDYELDKETCLWVKVSDE